MPKPSISVVVPAYNEEPVIEVTIRAILGALNQLSDDYEVVVVNDGSQDKTAAIVADLSRADPRVRRVDHVRNRGYGAALTTGFAVATRELVFLTDGDKQFDVGELADFLPLLDEADLVIGYREPRRDPLLRRLNGWGWNVLVNLLFGYTARDADCAFKLFRRAMLDGLQLRATGHTLSVEWLVKARRAGFQIIERPVSHYRRPAGRAKGAHPTAIARAFQELFWLRLRLNRESTVLSTAVRPVKRRVGRFG